MTSLYPTYHKINVSVYEKKQDNLFKQQIIIIKQLQHNKRLLKACKRSNSSDNFNLGLGCLLLGAGISTTVISGGIVGPFWISTGCFSLFVGAYYKRKTKKNLKIATKLKLELEIARRDIVNKLLQ